MSDVALDPAYRSFVARAPNRGVSDDAKTLGDSVNKVLEHLFARPAFVEPKRQASEALDDACEECAEDNWDGYGAVAVSPRTRDYAQRLLGSLPTTFPAPEISIEPDGEVAFEWHLAPRTVLSVSVGSTDELNYAALFGRSRAHGTECFGDELPETIIALLRRLLRQ